MINHTPDIITYCVTGFRTKNKDEVSETLVNLVATSGDEVLKDSWEHTTRTKKSVLTKFRAEVGALVNELNRSERHFVRCIRTNTQKEANSLEEAFVCN